MPTLLRILGVLLVVFGLIWILQGLGILTAVDSFMIGQRQWVVNGLVAVAAGLGFVGLGQMAARRRVRPARRTPL